MDYLLKGQNVGGYGSWFIEPTSGGSTDKLFMCNFQSCGLIGIDAS